MSNSQMSISIAATSGELFVVGPLDQAQQGGEVLSGSRRRSATPLKPNRAFSSIQCEDPVAGFLCVLGTGASVVAEDLVGPPLTGEELHGVEDDPVVLGPIPLVVDHSRPAWAPCTSIRTRAARR